MNMKHHLLAALCEEFDRWEELLRAERRRNRYATSLF